MTASTRMNAASAVLMLCAIVLTSTAMYRQLSGRAPRKAATQGIGTEPAWRQYADAPAWRGPADARVTIVEFADFQCPACREMAHTLEAIADRHAPEVRLIYRHYPLQRIHPQAYPAAIAAECARDQGRFAEFHRLAYSDPAALGVTAWTVLGRQAGIADSARFASCIHEQRTLARVERDLGAGRLLQVEGTPTLLVNGVRVNGAPSARVMDSIVTGLLGAR